jgi:HD-like signal output (HDOD) protein/prolyl-tRNA editing enzyme YbaK/EbsC (Cys-tRNA(Pro) deacylase)
MSIPTTLERFLSRQLAGFEVIVHPATATPEQTAEAAYVPLDQMLSATALGDRRGTVVAVYRATHQLDLLAINRQLRRELEILPEQRRTELFPGCDSRLVPPLAAAFGIKTLVDDAVGDTDDVYVEVSPTELVRMTGRELRRIQNAWTGHAIAAPRTERPVATTDPHQTIRARIQHITRLPAMPEMAQRILQLRANPYADARDLSRIVELDPSLAAQLIRYAGSPFFAYQGDVTSIHDAVSRVLGYDMASNIVLGIAVGQSFSNPPEGPLGLRAFWRHSVRCAALTQVLAKSLPGDIRPKPGLAYLAGMLHNFGFLLLGHLFQPEFYWLNKQVEKRPDAPILKLETDLLGVTHLELGTWLMEHWNMPGEILAAVREHHNPDYDGVHAIYAHLVLVANRLLKRQGLGDAESLDLPAALMEALSLSEEQVELVLTSVTDATEALDGIARQLAA